MCLKSNNKYIYEIHFHSGGVFLKKFKKFFKYAHNDLTILFKRGTIQSTKRLNNDFSFIFGGFY